jgi:hypothetical protein
VLRCLTGAGEYMSCKAGHFARLGRLGIALMLCFITTLFYVSSFPNIDNSTISSNQWWGEVPVPIWKTTTRPGVFPLPASEEIPSSSSFPSLDLWEVSAGESPPFPCGLAASIPKLVHRVILRGGVLIFLNSCSETVGKVFVRPSCYKSRPCIPFTVPRA